MRYKAVTSVPKRWVEGLATALITLISWVALGALGGVVAFLLYKGAGVLSWAFFTDLPRRGMQSGGIGPALVGSIYVTLVAIGVGSLVATAAGAYMSEFATSRRIVRFLEFLINTLAGIPSVVYGLFGLALFVVALGLGASILAGGLTLALLSLPLLVRNAQEAFGAVPKALKEASIGLGASELQTFFRITLPIALPRILTGLALATGRVLGETAPILFTAAVYYLPTYPKGLLEPTMLLPYHLYVLVTSGVDIRQTYPMAFGTALTLLGLTLAFTGLAAYLRFRLKRHYRV
ncbi:MAG: phosphate ABC transporter permease PstA [Bacteroidia bacterium]